MKIDDEQKLIAALGVLADRVWDQAVDADVIRQAIIDKQQAENRLRRAGEELQELRDTVEALRTENKNHKKAVREMQITFREAKEGESQMIRLKEDQKNREERRQEVKKVIYEVRKDMQKPDTPACTKWYEKLGYALDVINENVEING